MDLGAADKLGHPCPTLHLSFALNMTMDKNAKIAIIGKSRRPVLMSTMLLW